MNPDRITLQIVDAISALPVSTSAKEQGAVLVEGWMAQFEADEKWGAPKICAVEQPWYTWLSKNTLAVGVRDLCFTPGDDKEPFFGEWKTHKEPQRRKDGSYYKGQGPDEWALTIGSSLQLAAYGIQSLRMNPTLSAVPFLVRAAVKSTPPEFWEAKVDIPALRIAMAVEHFKQVADQIRALRKYDPPWNFSNNHKPFFRDCICSMPFTEPTGMEILSAVLKKGKVGDTDPGQRAIEQALSENPERNTSDLVILTSSGCELFDQCPEAYRRSLYPGGGEENENLAIGTVLHTGLAEWYRQIAGLKREEL